MEYFGVILKNAREKKNISLDTAHKFTKIPKEILNNIEADRISTINPTYLKGYIKIYSKYLGLDTAQIFEVYKSVLPKEEKVPSAEAIYQKKPEEQVSRLNFDFAILLNTAVVVVLVVSSVIFIRFLASKKNTSKPKAVAVSPKAKTAKPAVKEAARPKAKQDSGKYLDNVKLAIQAKENTYLQVSVDGSPMFRGVLRKGSTENWTAKEKIELSIGNASTVELELNGKVLPPFGRRNQPIKSMLIGRDSSIQIK